MELDAFKAQYINAKHDDSFFITAMYLVQKIRDPNTRMELTEKKETNDCIQRILKASSIQLAQEILLHDTISDIWADVSHKLYTLLSDFQLDMFERGMTSIMHQLDCLIQIQNSILVLNNGTNNDIDQLRHQISQYILLREHIPEKKTVEPTFDVASFDNTDVTTVTAELQSNLTGGCGCQSDNSQELLRKYESEILQQFNQPENMMNYIESVWYDVERGKQIAWANVYTHIQEYIRKHAPEKLDSYELLYNSRNQSHEEMFANMCKVLF